MCDFLFYVYVRITIDHISYGDIFVVNKFLLYYNFVFMFLCSHMLRMYILCFFAVTC